MSAPSAEKSSEPTATASRWRGRNTCVSRAALPIAVAIIGLLAGAIPGEAGARATRNLARYVNPFAGTEATAPDFGTGGGAGNTFPGAVVPFGMLQWSPETSPSSTNSAGGYTYGDTKIRGFSLTHLSGVGCPIFQDIPFLPTTVPVTVSPAMPGSYLVNPIYVPSFSHHGERAQPGYYRVLLGGGTSDAIRCELTATTRSGVGRFVYPPAAAASMLINAGGSAMANGDAVIEINPGRREVSGWVESGQFCYHRDRYKVFFTAEFDQPFSAYGTWKKQDLVPGSIFNSDHADSPLHVRPVTGFPNPPPTSNGAQAGAFVTFDTTRSRKVEVRVAISFVGVDNARQNLLAENAGMRFADVRKAARASWNDLLNRIQVRGGSRTDRRTFYTMLYHTLLGPNTASDANGEYMGMDGNTHTANGFTQYANFSGWDIYRSEIALLTMLDPGMAGDMARSLLTNATESGWLPKWPVASGQTNTMVGDPAAPIIAGAHAFGARGFEMTAALQAMLKGATQSGTSPNAEYVERAALGDYLALGYVPHDGTETSSGASTTIFGSTDAVWGSAATTLEYATADFAIAQYAAALGDKGTCQAFMQRAANWRNLFNVTTGYIQPRLADGLFESPFDPASAEGYVEGNAAQYTWMVPYDLAGLITTLGGPDAAAQRLDAFFTELNGGPTSPYAFLGNEPSAHTPWIYNWLGRPDKTQATVRRAVTSLFDSSPTGYPGNDDMGQMSSWYVFGSLGLYPAIPGVGVLALASPLFKKIDFHLPGGVLHILAPRAGRRRPYVRGLTLNGTPYAKTWIRFDDISQGGTMVYDLGSVPDLEWGTSPLDAPPSFSAQDAASCPDPPA